MKQECEEWYERVKWDGKKYADDFGTKLSEKFVEKYKTVLEDNTKRKEGKN